MKNYNKCFRSLNMGLPDDVERLKAAGYYEEAIARIDAYLAEDWTQTQNGPYSNGLTARPRTSPRTPPPRVWRLCGTRCWPSGRSCGASRPSTPGRRRLRW